MAPTPLTTMSPCLSQNRPIVAQGLVTPLHQASFRPTTGKTPRGVMDKLRISRTLTFALLLTAGEAGAQQPAARDTTHEAVSAATRQVPDSLLSLATVDEDSARALALGHLGGAAVESLALERVDGKLTWAFEMSVPGWPGRTPVHVDATDGSVELRCTCSCQCAPNGGECVCSGRCPDRTTWTSSGTGLTCSNESWRKPGH
jgi:Peptidase propeptide and YPEB domain